MGLLDDAIREHLELKRLRGADPGEIARLETEALGPVRRGSEPQAPPETREADGAEHAEPEPPSAHEPKLESVDEAPSAAAEHQQNAPPAAADVSVVDEETAEFDMSSVVGEPGPAEPGTLDERSEPAAQPEPAALPAPVHAPAPAHAGEPEPAQAAPPEHPAVASERAETGEQDVLEETPDFLQETPEHDRLWFEQRPPRDFDFDK
jgi:hypothetical protein